MTLRAFLSGWVAEQLIRAACWLLKAEELPPPPAEPQLQVPGPDWEQLARVDGVFRRVFLHPQRRFTQ